MKGAVDYQKLPGSGFPRGSWIRAVGGSSRSYLGDDHLLVVDRPSPVNEVYRRFPYADIEAIGIVRTKGYAGRLALLIAMVGLGVYGLTLVSFLWVFLGTIFTLGFGITLLVDLIKGPKARTIVRTRVQEAELASANRWRAAQKTLALLEPRIQGAQPVVTPAEPTFGESPEATPLNDPEAG